jgi:hypothetical protein
MRSPCRLFAVCAVLAITGCLETPIKRIDQDSSAVDRDAGVDAGPDAFVPQACETNEECKDPRASRCGPKNFCIPCGDNVDCEGIFGANVCIPDVGCFPCSDTDRGVCADPTPECHPQTHECVECTATKDAKCGGAKPFCDEGAGKCVSCRLPGNADCKTAEASVCKDSECAACTEPADCAHIPNKPQCHPTKPECVECWDNSHCPAEKPVCDLESGTCGGCSLPEHCGRFDDTKVCGPAGGCVQCIPASEAADCGDRACDPGAFTCTGAMRNSLSTCDKCISDSECIDGRKCVETNFASTPHGTYCLLAAPDDPSLCPNQYAAKRSAASILGVIDEYCFPDDTFTTCEAVRDFQKPCMGEDDKCGVEGVGDGLCRTGVCTYGCDAARDCSGSTESINKCISGAGAEQYCDPN